MLSSVNLDKNDFRENFQFYAGFDVTEISGAFE